MPKLMLEGICMCFCVLIKLSYQVTGADDLLVMSLEEEGLQHCINNLHSYTKQWVLELSFKKTKCVIFSKRHTNYDLNKNFIFGETIIQFENFYKLFRR